MEELRVLIELVEDAAQRECRLDWIVRRGTADEPEVLVRQGEDAGMLVLVRPHSQIAPAFVEHFHRPHSSSKPTIVNRRRVPAIIGAAEFMAWFTQLTVGVDTPVEYHLEAELLGEAEVVYIPFTDLEAALLSEPSPDLERRLARLAIGEATTLQSRIQHTGLSNLYLRSIERFVAYSEDVKFRAGSRWDGQINSYALRRYLETALHQKAGEISRLLARMEHSGLISAVQSISTGRRDHNVDYGSRAFRIEDARRLELLAGFARQRADTDVIEARQWIWTRIRSGALLSARNAALDLHAQFPQDPELVYLAALAMARLGARDEAVEMLSLLLDRNDRAPSRPEIEQLVRRISGSAEFDEGPQWAYPLPRELGAAECKVKIRELVRDIVALSARVEKDAFAQEPEGSEVATTHACRAFECYRVLSNWLPNDHYSAVNAAAMAALIRDDAAAKSFAERAEIAATSDPSYWGAASLTEALLIAGKMDEAVSAARRASLLAHSSNPGDVASTRRQLNLLKRRFSQAARLIEELPDTATVAFSGHLMPANMPIADVSRHELTMSAELEKLYATHSVGTLFTALARGSDLISARAAMNATDKKVVLHVVLPFDLADFRKYSVAAPKNASGRDWGAQFDDLIAHADKLTIVCRKPMKTVDRWAAIVIANWVMTGLALLQADRFNSARLLFVAVSTGGPSKSAEGTVALVQDWRRHHLPVTILPCGWRQAASGEDVVIPPLPFRLVASIRSPAEPLSLGEVLAAMPADIVTVVAKVRNGADISLPLSPDALASLARLSGRLALSCFADLVYAPTGAVDERTSDGFPEAPALPAGILVVSEILAAVVRFHYNAQLSASPIGVRERDRKGQKSARGLAPSDVVYRIAPSTTHVPHAS